MANELSECRVLVVEDEPIVALDLAEVLERHGAIVVGPTGNVADARRLVAGSQIDCAVLDVDLGRESVAPLVRELGVLQIPFVFMTGYDEKDLSPLWRAHPILHKPMLADALVDALRRVCSFGPAP
jgi:CheY-like chemotaxis protein